MTKEDYTSVLDQRFFDTTSASATHATAITKVGQLQENRGFVFKNNTMTTYVMKREGLKYLYTKRKVLADGLSTTYLDI